MFKIFSYLFALKFFHVSIMAYILIFMGFLSVSMNGFLNSYVSYAFS